MNIFKRLWDKLLEPRKYKDDSPFPELRLSQDIIDELQQTKEERKKGLSKNRIVVRLSLRAWLIQALFLYFIR